jgi:trk system potassium uptake protein TrkH
MGHFATPSILWASTTFMLIGSLPFVVMLQMFRKGPAVLLRNEQIVFFVVMVVLSALVGTLLFRHADHSAAEALTTVAFNVVSIITTTGYASTDYTLWGPFFTAMFLFLMFTGGCSGSTAGSIKVFRIQIALKMFSLQLKKLVHPNGVFVVRLNDRRVNPEIISALVSFIFAIALMVIGITTALAAMGLDLVTALSSAATAVTNVGPGLGDIVGPAGNFAPLPGAAKWLLALAMLMGRLELMTIFVLLMPAYWRA